jgi:hypothetical protein
LTILLQTTTANMSFLRCTLIGANPRLLWTARVTTISIAGQQHLLPLRRCFGCTTQTWRGQTPYSMSSDRSKRRLQAVDVDIERLMAAKVASLEKARRQRNRGSGATNKQLELDLEALAACTRFRQAHREHSQTSAVQWADEHALHHAKNELRVGQELDRCTSEWLQAVRRAMSHTLTISWPEISLMNRIRLPLKSLIVQIGLGVILLWGRFDSLYLQYKIARVEKQRSRSGLS